MTAQSAHEELAKMALERLPPDVSVQALVLAEANILADFDDYNELWRRVRQAGLRRMIAMEEQTTRKPPVKAGDSGPAPVGPKIETNSDMTAALLEVARAIDRLCDVMLTALELQPDEEAPAAVVISPIARNEQGRCARCNGTGALGDGQYCSCATGRDLEVIERRGMTLGATDEE